MYTFIKRYQKRIKELVGRYMCSFHKVSLEVINVDRSVIVYQTIKRSILNTYWISTELLVGKSYNKAGELVNNTDSLCQMTSSQLLVPICLGAVGE